ncbi:uncharacterized protein FIBRA_09191 [Fibroporia radiculosa]|uniref:Uncharacterized protein n=1 Tax=Fibroporia radiculosa TaxID=599839 RepID=J7RH39_9APHY|nr:uncharacterized protein FIBRA_09191 [Fibroporia radiculosa]CCM06882.1 predicted protein [Fibroporia radiculosa]
MLPDKISGGMGEGVLGSGGDVECPLVFSFQMPDCKTKGEGDNEGEGEDGKEGDEKFQEINLPQPDKHGLKYFKAPLA